MSSRASHGAIGGDTLAEGIAVKEPGQLTRAIIAELVDRIDLVAERDIEHAVAMLVEIEKTVVEGAGAAGLAAILAQPERFRGRKVGTILCGGNIDTHLLANVLVRELVRCGRIARLRIAAQDRPGALAAITAKFHECGVNIIEINHQPHLHPPAGQGHGDRGRMRGARRPARSTRWSSGSKAPASTSSGPSWTEARPRIDR